jgi:CRISPR-associated protein Csh1
VLGGESLLKDCRNLFEKLYSKKGDKLITDNYILPEGSYVVVNKDKTFKVVMEVDKKNRDKFHQSYEELCHKDYLSRLIDMNKPVDPKKQIHSNNYCSFYVKKDVVNDKLTNDIIDGYYQVLINPALKYSGKKKQIFENIEKVFGKTNQEAVIENRKWIKENLREVIKLVKQNKDYLKIFFDEDIEIYEAENQKYVIPNLFNSNDYNTEIENITYGLPNNNMGLNSKKPYLEHKDRKKTVPLLLSIDEALMQKKLFDYLHNYASDSKYNVYFDEQKFYVCDDKELFLRKHSKFQGGYLRIKKGTELEIHDYDTVSYSDKKISAIKVRNVLDVNYQGIETGLNYGKVENIDDVSGMINEIYFNKFLSTNYFSDPSDIRLNDLKIKEALILTRKAFGNWFYKGNDSSVKCIIEKVTKSLIKNSISNGYILRAREQYNLRCALLEYFKIGGVKMGDQLEKLRDGLREKINSDVTSSFDRDEEYYFGIGQIISFLISKSKSSKTVHSLINPIINSKSEERIRENIKKLFKKYNYDINKNNKRFNNLYSMISGYNSGKIVNDDLIIAGYLYTNLIYEKN